MYPKAEPTPVTSSAPPAGTLYSPPVVRSQAAEHEVAGHRPVPQPSSALLGSDWIPVLGKTLLLSLFFGQKLCAQLALRCLCCWHEARVAACSSCSLCLAEGGGCPPLSAGAQRWWLCQGQVWTRQLCGSCSFLVSLNGIPSFSSQNSSAPLAEDIDPEVWTRGW